MSLAAPETIDANVSVSNWI